jgi:hypothetical protein
MFDSLDLDVKARQVRDLPRAPSAPHAAHWSAALTPLVASLWTSPPGRKPARGSTTGPACPC